MPLPFKFVEQKNQVYYHDLKVYVMGSDVTPWLTSDVSVTYAENGGINTATFSLSNQQNAFTLTKANLMGNTNGKGFRRTDPNTTGGEYSELAKHSIWSLKNSKDKEGKSRNVSHEVNTFGPYEKGDRAGVIQNTQNNANQSTSSATFRYPFAPGSLVFHKFDQVRIFAKNPLSIRDEWFCVFTGFLDTKPVSEDLVTGMSTIRMSCQDIRYAMQRMRTQSNPASSIGNQNATQFSDANGKVSDSPNAGFFNDLVTPYYQMNHVLGGLSFQQTMSFLILGVPRSGLLGEAEASLSGGSNSGSLKVSSKNNIGELTMGGPSDKPGPVFYDSSADDNKKKELLAKWNNLVLFGQYVDNPKFMSFGQMTIMGQNTHEWGAENIWARKVHFLYPAEGSPNSNLVETSIAQANIKDKVQWASRLELILSVCENIDYIMYVSPLGDVVFEFPMWDFSPKDFGSEYERVYKFKDHVISRDTNDEGGEAISAVIIQSNQLFAETTPTPTVVGATTVATNMELTRTIYSNALASRVGVQVKTIVKPGITDHNALSQLGMIEFAKANAEYNKYSFKAQYRPFLGINRPVMDFDAYKIGGIRTLSTTWRIRDTVDIEMDLSYVRRGEIDSKGNITYRFITGGEASPMSYNKIFNDTSIPKNGASVATPNPNGESEQQ